ncbi:MAG: hypothetical protein BAA04_10285 [Firmicutes bacterium ZCTH02-B6]|nr:MAG: hypothetical protein BAA04_10285 [Firmicutes bacterium ZCTH02-B6]
MKKALLVMAASAGLAAGFVLGALQAAGPLLYWPVARLGAGAGDGPAVSPVSLPAAGDQVLGFRLATGDLIPGGGDEIAVGVTLAGGGVVAVFRRQGDVWVEAARMDGFAAIDGLEVRSATGAGWELFIYDEHDELTGAFYLRRGLTILKWRAGAFVPVWAGTLYEEAYSLDPPMAERIVSAAEVNAGRGELVVRGLHTRARREADGAYRDVEEAPLSGRWRWDDGLFRFVAVPGG